jgi:hypothetical protein
MHEKPESASLSIDKVLKIEVKGEGYDDGFIPIIPDISCPGRSEEFPIFDIYSLEMIARNNLQQRTEDLLADSSNLVPPKSKESSGNLGISLPTISKTANFNH